MKIMNIVAWVLVAILAIGAGALGFLNHQQAGKGASLRDTLAQAATAAGVEGFTADGLKNTAALPDLLKEVQAKVAELNLQLSGTKDALTAAQNEASGAKTDAGTLTQKLQEQTAQAEALTKDVAAKAEEIAAAKAEAEKTAQALKEAQEAAGKQKAELESALEGVKAQMAEETAKLQAELEAARQAAAAATAAAQAAVATAESPAVEEEPVPEAKAAAKAAKPAKPAKAAKVKAVEEPKEEAWERGGEVIGESEMFSAIRYSYPDQALLLRLWDGQKLAYQDVSAEAYEQLIGNVNTLDMNFRFNIQGKFKSLPPDSIVVRKFWKDSRRKHYRGDVRLIEPVPAPVVEEPAPVEAAAPAEVAVPAEPAAPAAEAAPAAAGN